MNISKYSHEKLLMLASEIKNENIKAYQISKDEQLRLDYFESRIKSVILPFIKARIWTYQSEIAEFPRISDSEKGSEIDIFHERWNNIYIYIYLSGI